MKNRIMVFLVALLPLFIVSCDNMNNDFDEYQAIVGDWYSTTTSMSCEFDGKYCYGGTDGGSIEALIYHHVPNWDFNDDTHVEYVLYPNYGKLTLHLYNVNPITKEIYDEVSVDMDYYFLDYDHLSLDGYVFERGY